MLLAAAPLFVWLLARTRPSVLRLTVGALIAPIIMAVAAVWIADMRHTQAEAQAVYDRYTARMHTVLTAQPRFHAVAGSDPTRVTICQPRAARNVPSEFCAVIETRLPRGHQVHGGYEYDSRYGDDVGLTRCFGDPDPDDDEAPC